MKNMNLKRMILLMMLIAGMAVAGLFSGVRAAEDSSGAAGRYLKDIYIAYGKTEEEAAGWLQDNGWEPLYLRRESDRDVSEIFDENAAIVLGISRTDDSKEALTDLFFENMKGSRGQTEGQKAPGSGGTDLENADREWLAIYTSRSPEKGDPILASSLTVQIERSALPEKGDTGLKLFAHPDAGISEYHVYSYHKKYEISVFWHTDHTDPGERPGNEASVFSAGKIGLIATGGIMVGILGATMVLLPKKRREEEQQEQ